MARSSNSDAHQTSLLTTGGLVSPLKQNHQALNPENQDNPNAYLSGYFKCYYDRRKYGFIRTADFGDVICYEDILQTMVRGDLVFFRKSTSRSNGGDFVAKNVQVAYMTKDNNIVVDRTKSQLSKDILAILPSVIGGIQCNGREFVSEQIDFPYYVGKSNCVAVSRKDTIVYAQKIKGQKGLSKFVKYSRPVPTKSVTVTLLKTPEYYLIIAAYFGVKAEPFPWDAHATERSIPFWERHALVFNSNAILAETQTSHCPWESRKVNKFNILTTLLRNFRSQFSNILRMVTSNTMTYEIQ